MTIDRQQIRRDAEKCISQRTDWLSAGTEPPDTYAQTFARHCLALLAELEDLERDYRQRYDWAMHQRDLALSQVAQAERQLAALKTNRGTP